MKISTEQKNEALDATFARSGTDAYVAGAAPSGVGPAWQIAEVCPGNADTRISLVCKYVNPELLRNLRAFMHQSLPVDVTAYPAAPATSERDAHEAVGHRRGMEDAIDIARGCGVNDTSFKAQAAALRKHLAKIRAEGFETFIGGNLGDPLCHAVDTPAADEGGRLVVEVSSYQLEKTVSFRPTVAVHLNLTPDHLDRHGTMTGYGDAKALIARNLADDATLVLNGDDPELQRLLQRMRRPPGVYFFSLLGPPPLTVEQGRRSLVDWWRTHGS